MTISVKFIHDYYGYYRPAYYGYGYYSPRPYYYGYYAPRGYYGCWRRGYRVC
jgi:hypothetical protein